MSEAAFFIDYDVSSTSYIYGVYGPWQNARKFISTTGSSTTVVSAVASTGALAEVDVGDRIYVRNVSVPSDDQVGVTAKASDDSITTSTAKDFGRDVADSGYPYQFRKFLSGTTANDGWHYCGNEDDKFVTLQLDTINATSIDFQIEGKFNDGVPFVITTQNFTAATVASGVNTVVGGAAFGIPENLSAVRVGVKVNTDGGAQKLSAHYRGVPRRRQ